MVSLCVICIFSIGEDVEIHVLVLLVYLLARRLIVEGTAKD